MDFLINDTLVGYVKEIGLLPVLAIVYVVTLTIFWFEGHSVKKNSNSIFDQWFVTTILMFVWGRISYIVLEWDQFIGGFWFLAPYERYLDEIYWFRAMPWKIFRIWDGGFVFLAMYFALLIGNYLYIRYIKRWRWKEMMVGTLVSANFMLGLTFYVYGLYISVYDLSRYGVVLTGFTSLFLVTMAVARFIYRRNIDAFVRIGQILITLYSITTIYLFSSIFIPQKDLSIVDQTHVYATIGLLIYMLLVFLLDIRKGDVVVDHSEGLKSQITLNQAIKVQQ